MSRWIDAEWLLNFFEPYPNDYQTPLGSLRACVDDAPSIDIEPKRGEWIVHKERTEVNDGFIDFFPTEYECSNCGLKQSMYFINSKPSNFCPNCGADMREREGE